MFTYSQWLVDFFAKAAGHKYIKRIPYLSQGKTRYRYIYKLTHMAGGKHVLDPEHMVVGAAFQMETGAGKEVHAHIVSTSGENVTYRLDDGPDKDKVFTVTRAQLAQKLNEKHGVHGAISAERDKQAKVVADLKAGGASTKQVAREQARLDRLEAALPAPAPAPKSEDREGEERVKDTATRLLAALRSPARYTVRLSSSPAVTMPTTWDGFGRYGAVSADTTQLLEQITATPAVFTPRSFPTKQQGVTQLTHTGKLEDVTKDVISAPWVPKGYIASLDNDMNMIDLTISEGAFTGRRALVIPPTMLNVHTYQDRVARLPIVSAETMGDVKSVVDALMTADALPHHLAASMGRYSIEEIKRPEAPRRKIVSDVDELADNILTEMQDHYGNGYRFKLETRVGMPRIYVSRRLSRGWQNMGYISVNDEGKIHDVALTRLVGELRDFVEDQLNLYKIKEPLTSPPQATKDQLNRYETKEP